MNKMIQKKKIKNDFLWIVKMIRYNFGNIFGGKFLWFFLSALIFFCLVAVISVWNGRSPDESFVYGNMIFPAILLIFYPMTFGIQKDLDAGILEILFGIPNYRYKVWLFRLLLVFILVFLLMFVFGILATIFLTPVNLLKMSYQVMYPVFFLGCMGFMFSTIIKNGSGTAVVIVIIGIMIFFSESYVNNTMWDVFLNPFNMPSNINESIWENTIIKNRIFLSVGAILFLLTGIMNLQNREKFI